jgi:hypothetical protein
MNEQRDMTGILFKNDKGDNPRRPDYTGNITVNGEMFRLAGWVKQGKKGSFLGLAVSEPRNQQAEQKAPEPTLDDFDDDIPF